MLIAINNRKFLYLLDVEDVEAELEEKRKHKYQVFHDRF